jgi:hypothetical protein
LVQGRFPLYDTFGQVARSLLMRNVLTVGNGRRLSAQARFQATPWLFAVGDDVRFPATLVKRSSSMHVYCWYRLNAGHCPG